MDDPTIPAKSASSECEEGYAASRQWLEGDDGLGMATGVKLYSPDGDGRCHKLVGRIASGNKQKILVDTLTTDGDWVPVEQSQTYTQSYYWIRSEDPMRTGRLKPLP